MSGSRDGAGGTDSASDLVPVPVRSILGRYSAVLLDAYGVLVDASGALPGSRELVRDLRAAGRAFAVVTNDMTRTPREWESLLGGHGIEIPSERIVTSGLLLGRFFAEHGLIGAPIAVVGSAAIERRVREAGGVVVPPETDRISAVVLGSSRGFPLLDVLEATLSSLYRHLDRGDRVHLVLPNPDIVYPVGGGSYGFASGALAELLEAGLRRRYPCRDDIVFVRLGKPHAPIFAAALALVGDGPTLMIGDQLETDIAGAQGSGIDSALVVTGVSAWDPRRAPGTVRPTYLLRGLGAR